MRRVASSGVWPGRTPISPSVAGSTTSSACTSMIFRSRVTTVRLMRFGRSAIALRSLALHLLVLLEHVLDRSLQQERLLRDVVVLAVDDLAEAFDRVGDLDVLTLDAGELLGHEERLREEALDLPGARHDDLVLFRQLVDAQDGDDVLEVLVLLKDRLHRARGVVVLVAEDARIEDLRSRSQRIDGRVDAELRDLARENGRGVEVSERGGRRRVREVVGGNVDGLDRGDRALLRRG